MPQPDEPTARPAPAGSGQPGPGPSTAGSRTVLDASEMSRAITRMAHQILEANQGAANLVLAGIPRRGVALAERLAATVEAAEQITIPVGELDVTMYRDDLRRQPTRPVGRTRMPLGIDDRVVVLVDDVLFSGRTVRAALDALGELGRPRAVRLAVLVDRGHRELPIRADHVGKNIPTAAEEQVRVSLTESDGWDEVMITRPAADADDGDQGAVH